jgi:prenyltransferase beta subunit
MTDKVVDSLLEIIKSSKYYSFEKYSEKRDERTLFDLFQLKRRLMYLDYDLNLIKVIEETENFVIYDLTVKGKKVLNNGGWEKYSKYEKRKEKRKNIRTNVLFGIAILSPLITVYFSNKKLNLEKEKSEQEKQYIIQLEKLEQELNNAKTLKFVYLKLDSLISLRKKSLNEK